MPCKPPQVLLGLGLTDLTEAGEVDESLVRVPC